MTYYDILYYDTLYYPILYGQGVGGQLLGQRLRAPRAVIASDGAASLWSETPLGSASERAEGWEKKHNYCSPRKVWRTTVQTCYCLKFDEVRSGGWLGKVRSCSPVLHPVSITRFPSFRTQTLESLSVDSVKNGLLSNPDPGENLVSGNLVMETGCTTTCHWPGSGTGEGEGANTFIVLLLLVEVVVVVVVVLSLLLLTCLALLLLV